MNRAVLSVILAIFTTTAALAHGRTVNFIKTPGGGGGGVTDANSASATSGEMFSGVGTFQPLKTTAFSAAIWVKLTGTSFYLIGSSSNSSGQGWELANNSAGTTMQPSLQLWTTSNTHFSATTTATWADGLWHHIVSTYDGSNTVAGIALYVDGAAQAVSTTGSTLSADLPTGCIVSIGFLTNASGCNTASTPTHTYSGKLDWAAIWSTTLTSGQVTTLYNSGTPIDPTTVSGSGNVVDFWPLGEGSDTTSTLVDVVSANNLTGSGLTFSNDVP